MDLSQQKAALNNLTLEQ